MRHQPAAVINAKSFGMPLQQPNQNIQRVYSRQGGHQNQWAYRDHNIMTLSSTERDEKNVDSQRQRQQRENSQRKHPKQTLKMTYDERDLKISESEKKRQEYMYDLDREQSKETFQQMNRD